MKAVRNAPPGVEVIDIDEPEGVGELVRIRGAGICASDLSYLRWGSTQIAGHEFAGQMQDGTAVAVEAIFGCPSCPQCDEGHYNMCERGVVGLGLTDPGGMCEWFRAPQRALVPLPEGLGVANAFLVEPASVARHSCHVGEVGPGSRVAVVGAGAIGILVAASAQSMGAAEVALVARHRHQHEAREMIGVEEPTDRYDVVIETGGTNGALHEAVALARTRGRVVYVGAYQDEGPWPYMEAFQREIAFVGSLGYSAHAGRREFAESADMLATRPELVETLVTHRFPIEDAAEAFRTAQDRSKGVFRVVVEP